MNDLKYYTAKQLQDGADRLPIFTASTLRNARLHKKLKYTKVGRECVYRRDWVLDYLKQNERNTTKGA